jgi:hypothetical protein
MGLDKLIYRKVYFYLGVNTERCIFVSYKNKETMTTQLNNIIELAAKLIIEGKATEENAIQMAIEQDNNKCLEVIEDMADMRRGYINERNTNQKGFEIVRNSVYERLSK